ncbi:MAG: gluconate 2-dehydrogenase subunit 3 family protein, partial [Acidobacteriaceae bacterium]|nr:gluconate 2-dehydrogenase subunit 3 family protein [Acidobacteriaceae bacterium]
ELANLRRLAALLVPSTATRPGAKEAGAPEFLDFLISESPADRQHLYRRGLAELESQSRSKFGKSFAAIPENNAATLLAPLEKPWTFEGPADELSRFLVDIKDDMLRATMNSRLFATVSGGRRGTGMGSYWLPLD